MLHSSEGENTSISAVWRCVLNTKDYPHAMPIYCIAVVQRNSRPLKQLSWAVVFERIFMLSIHTLTDFTGSWWKLLSWCSLCLGASCSAHHGGTCTHCLRTVEPAPLACLPYDQQWLPLHTLLLALPSFHVTLNCWAWAFPQVNSAPSYPVLSGLFVW